MTPRPDPAERLFNGFEERNRLTLGMSVVMAVAIHSVAFAILLGAEPAPVRPREPVQVTRVFLAPPAGPAPAIESGDGVAEPVKVSLPDTEQPPDPAPLTPQAELVAEPRIAEVSPQPKPAPQPKAKPQPPPTPHQRVAATAPDGASTFSGGGRAVDTAPTPPRIAKGAAEVPRASASDTDSEPEAPAWAPEWRLGGYRMPAPEYPAPACRARMEGRVVLTVRVAPSGRVEAVSIAESSGWRLLDIRARDTVSRWQFQPAAAGITSPAIVSVPVRFVLR